MLLTSTNDNALATTAEGAAVVRALDVQSVAFRVSTVVPTDATVYSFPRVQSDPQAAWVAEGAELPLSDADVDDDNVTPRKLGALSKLSREVLQDNPLTSRIVYGGLVRDLARKADVAFFGNLSLPAPAGLGSITPTVVDAGATFTNADPFDEAIANAEDSSTVVNYWVANSATALALAQLKAGTGSNVPLLGSDPEAPTRKVIRGVPLLVSPAVEAGVVWGIPTDHVLAVVRRDVSVEVSEHAFFTSDSVAVRGTLRVAYAFPFPESVQRIELTP